MKTEFYKMEYESWDEGTDCLTLEQEGAYLRLCHQMYRRRGSIPNETRTLARLWRCHPNKAAALVNQLIALGKITLTPEGHLTNTRVTQELDSREMHRTNLVEAGRKGGIQRAENAKNAKENNVTDQADASSQSNQIREDKSREESIPAAFDRFWESYPKRKGGNPRHPAYLKFIAAVKAGADPEAIIRGVKQYADECERLGKLGGEYVKQAQWWLNQKQWQDYAAVAETKDQAIAEFDKKVLVFEDTPQGKAWETSRRAERGVGVSWHDIRDPVTSRIRAGAYFDSEWPPGHSDKQAA